MIESESDLMRSNLEPNEQTSLRQSDRVSRQPDRYLGFLIQDGDSVELDKNNENPIIYMDTM